MQNVGQFTRFYIMYHIDMDYVSFSSLAKFIYAADKFKC